MSEQNNKERISVSKCRSVLKQTGVGLSDEQIIAIRNYLYELAQIDCDIFMSAENIAAQVVEEPNPKIKSLNQNTDFKEAA